MTEDQAQAWIAANFGDDAVARLGKFVALLFDEMPRQNLISVASMYTIWTRHLVDSAQLLRLCDNTGLWIDIGTGAGFPGIVTGLLSDHPTLLVEPRRRRVEFLQRAIYELDLGDRVEVRHAKAEAVSEIAGIISARAVASIDALLTAAKNCSNKSTQWLLPKGHNAREEVAQAKKAWHGTFHVEQSVTDPTSMIVVASGIAHR